MNTVLILSRGEYMEGGSILGVFEDSEDGDTRAWEAATIYQKESYGDWDGGPAADPEEPDLLWRWEAGCDWMTIARHKVG